MSPFNIEAPIRSIGKDPNIITQAVMLAYTGWGYNFYSATNKLRADDLLIRGKISELLSRSARDINGFAAKLASDVPSPSREDPLPGREVMQVVVKLRKLASEADALSSRMTSLTSPGRDQILDRHRKEADTLLRLQGFDLYLGQLAFDLQALLQGKSAADMEDEAVRGDIEVKLKALQMALRDREDMLRIGG